MSSSLSSDYPSLCSSASNAQHISSGLNRRTVLKGAVGLSALSLGLGLGPALAGAKAKINSFALAIMPDTQFYARYASENEHQSYQHQYGSTPYWAQTKFIAGHAETYNIPFTIHLGDVVDQSGKEQQWQIADKAMKALEDAEMPYSICAGNHDVLDQEEYLQPDDQTSGTDAQRIAADEPYLKWFPTERAARNSTFVERDPSGWHEAHIFQGNGARFMVVSMSWRASDAAINWARDVIGRHPDLPVILVNHQLLDIAPDGLSPLEVPYGEMLWDKLIRDTDQIFMTLNGHYHGGAHLRKTNDFGNSVDEMVVDYQMAYQGGNALMRLYEFDFTNNKIDVASFSPWVVEKPKDTLNHFDRAWLTEPNHQFSIAIDFKKRFAGFTDFAPSLVMANAILPRVKADLFANYVEPPQPVKTPARDENDYPKVDKTLAHWRVPADALNKAVPIGAVLPDLTGKNAMVRMATTGEDYAPVQNGNVTFTSDRHYLSSAAGSVRFLKTNKNSPIVLNYFSTATDAPLNSEVFADGYTIEAFIKFDANWSAENNRWSNVLTRSGNRGSLPGFAGGDPESPPILFSISNLREIQWEVVAASDTTQSQTDWSGEIMRDTWYHVAIVNDAKAKTTIMYLEGAPVIRAAAGQVGIASVGADQPWLLGCSLWDGALADGWFGAIGEIRVVGAALDEAQWLTSRA